MVWQSSWEGGREGGREGWGGRGGREREGGREGERERIPGIIMATLIHVEVIQTRAWLLGARDQSTPLLVPLGLLKPEFHARAQ